MKQLSIRGTLVMVLLFALVFALFARLHEEAFFYVSGPVLGAMLAAWVFRSDRSALITGGVIGGFCQGAFAILILKRGYPFSDVQMMTGGLFLASLATHLILGLVFGALLHVAFRWTRPKQSEE